MSSSISADQLNRWIILKQKGQNIADLIRLEGDGRYPPVLISSHVCEECLNVFASLDTLRFESLAECIFVHMTLERKLLVWYFHELKLHLLKCMSSNIYVSLNYLDNHALLSCDLGVVSSSLLQTLRKTNLQEDSVLNKKE